MADQRTFSSLVTREVMRTYVAGALGSTDIKVNLPAAPLVVRSRVVAGTVNQNQAVPFDGAAGSPLYTQQTTVNTAGTLFTAQLAGYYRVRAVVDSAQLVLGLQHVSALGVPTLIATAAGVQQPVQLIQFLNVGESFALIQTSATPAPLTGSMATTLEIEFVGRNTTL